MAQYAANRLNINVESTFDIMAQVCRIIVERLDSFKGKQVHYITLHYITLHYITLLTMERTMKKLCALAIAIISANTFAERNLQIDATQMPPPMQQTTQEQQYAVVQNEQAYQPQTYRQANQFSIAAGYSGSDLKDSDGYGEKGKGFFINGAYHFDDSVNVWLEFDKQKTSDINAEFSDSGVDVKAKASYDLTEIAMGVQYKWNSERLYAGIGTGLGFSRLKYNADANAVIDGVSYSESESETYDYYTWRVADLEFGAKFNQNLSAFANVGYKLLLSLETDTECGSFYCETGRAEDMDLDGVTYKAGLRYSF